MTGGLSSPGLRGRTGAFFVLLAVASAAQVVAAQDNAAADTVHVALPTGEIETDRASILAALEQVERGGTVQFAPGTYRIGEAITVAVPEVTLLGHPDGTTLRGCDPGAFEDRDFAVAECNGFNLTGGDQAVRDLTFEYAWHALILGGQPCQAGDCPPETLPVDARTGGYVVEQNTFRETPNSTPPTNGYHSCSRNEGRALRRSPGKRGAPHDGNSFVSIVEFTRDGPVARSIVAYGNSTDLDSPHYEDQAAMFARGRMKPVLFEMEDILANLEERYRPGEREGG